MKKSRKFARQFALDHEGVHKVMTNPRFPRLFLLIAFIAACAATSHAIPARPGLTTVTQPDGSSLAVRIVGDESFHYCLSEDGYLLLDQGGVMRYAVPDADGAPVPSSVIAAAPSRRDEATRRMLRDIDTDALVGALRRSAAPAHAPAQGPGLFLNASFPTVGAQRAIVILVEYRDVKFRLQDPADYFGRMLNQPGFSD